MHMRPRRNRLGPGIRALVRETALAPDDLILPLFVCAGEDRVEPIDVLPGCARQSVDRVVATAREAQALGIRAVALFPVIAEADKDARASVSADPDNLACRCVRALKAALPELVVMTDVAMDPYSSDGHDGVVRDGRVCNDETLPILARMAVTQAAAGADVVAPSDMMDGRVAAIRDALDQAGHAETLICSYCVKYASAFYGPFRAALDSAPRAGDKRSYQMDPGNVRECRREVAADEAEGADWLMVKPGLPYLDVVRAVAEQTVLPVVAYHVSGEYAMLRCAAERGALDYRACLLESLAACKRAGARMVVTYGALDAARFLTGD